MSTFPIVKLAGGPRERGLSHGRQLSERIHRTFDFYNDVVFRNAAISASQFQDRAIQLMEITKGFSPDLLTEIEGIAEAANIEPWRVFLLNARTEILNASVAECTSMAVPESRILAQTWDWIRELEDLVVVADVENEHGVKFVTLTEPGMLAKIGMNGHGLGVGLNFLKADHRLDGVPVHLVLRELLNCSTLAEARDVVSRSGSGKASFIPVATAAGEAAGFEFAGNATAELAAEGGVLLHTNHCISHGLTGTMLPTSQERYSTTARSLEGKGIPDFAAIEMLLSDKNGEENAVLSDYHPIAEMGGLHIGTCATIIMELDKRMFHIRRGPSPQGHFVEIALQ